MNPDLLPALVIAVAPGTLERFARDIGTEGPEGCWPRKPDPTRKGYGRVSLNGRRYEAHVASYLMFTGPIPDGYVIDHLCHDPEKCDPGPDCPHRSCVNPAHLEPVTAAVNAQRGGGPSGRNARKTHCIRGHEFTPENTYTPPGGSGRTCRTCMLARDSARSEGRKLGGHNARKTHCPQGHPYDEENTYWTAKGRSCKECMRASTRRRRQRLREAAT